jgi:hypothetical protein
MCTIDYKMGVRRRDGFFFFSYGFGEQIGVLWCLTISSSWEFYGLKEREMQQFSYFSNFMSSLLVLIVNCHVDRHQVIP